MFKRSEDQQRGSGPWHGTGGPMPVTDLPEKHPIAEAFIAAGVNVGIPRNSYFNGERQEGIGPFQGTARRGLRYSTAKAFLRRALKRQNIDLVMHAQVARILFDGVRASGVVFVHVGPEVRISANREIILSAAPFSRRRSCNFPESDLNIYFASSKSRWLSRCRALGRT